MTDRDTEALKIGLIVPSRRLPVWQVEAIKRLFANDKIQICIAYGLSYTSSNDEQYPMFQRLNRIAQLLLKFDQHLFSKSNRFGSNALELVEISEDEFLPSFKWQHDTDGCHAGALHESARDEIDGAKLDILFDLGACLTDEDASLARYGIWRHVHHPTLEHESCLPGVFESIYSRPVTGTRLEAILPNSEDPITVASSSSTTYDLSSFVNRSNSAWSGVALFEREATKLRLQGAEHYFSAARKNYAGANDVTYAVGSLRGVNKSVWFWIRYSWKIFMRLIEERTRWDQWYLLFDFVDHVDIEDLDVGKFRAITPPVDEFWADPHVFVEGDTYYVFLEVYTNRKSKGHISVIEIDKSGNVSDPVLVLEKDYHLSYPMIIRENNEIYMLPETKGNRSIEIYRCERFPYEWKLEMTLMDDVMATDATPFLHNGKWWLFAAMTQSEHAACTEELHLFYSDQLLSSDWVSHPQNPIVTDARSARPAGKIFNHNGKLIRPSQDCSYRYGYGLVFNEITMLSETRYEEKRVSMVRPTWEDNVKGIHSYSKADRIVLLDAMKSVRRTR